MNILILGSRGFIGASLADYFINRGHVVFGCDVVEYTSQKYKYFKLSILSTDFETIFSDHQFAVCINASGSGNVGFSVLHPLSDFEFNTYSVARVLDTLRKYQVTCKYIHISSAAVYGNPIRLPIQETDSAAPLSPYGYNKLMSEQVCTAYHKLYNIPVSILRPFSVYGNGLRKQLLWDIACKIAAADVVELYGTGNESRDFIHIDDLVVLIELIISKSNFCLEIFNAASGEETTIRQIADIFLKHYNTKKLVFKGQQKKGDPLNWRADISKAYSMGFATGVSLEKGIAEYVKWFETNAAQ